MWISVEKQMPEKEGSYKVKVRNDTDPPFESEEIQVLKIYMTQSGITKYHWSNCTGHRVVVEWYDYEQQ